MTTKLGKEIPKITIRKQMAIADDNTTTNKAMYMRSQEHRAKAEKEKQVIKPRCPECKSANVVSMIFGFPAFDEKLEKQLKNKEVALGGCVVYEEYRDEWHCNECGHEF